MIPLKKRTKIFFCCLVMFLSSLCSWYLFYDGVSEYLSFPESFSLSSKMLYPGIFPLFIIPVVMFCYHPVVYGKSAPDSWQLFSLRFTFILFIAFIPLSIGFDIILIHELDKKGYIACRGVHSGGSPGGGATRYALSQAICDKWEHRYDKEDTYRPETRR